MMVAGHETTAATLAWIMYELSRHPEFQTRVREEIRQTRAHAAQRGDADFNVEDLDSMKCLLALIKVWFLRFVHACLDDQYRAQETLRFHPIVVYLDRVAGRDDVIPLSTTQTTIKGETITSIPVRKGQKILLSIAAYNRCVTHYH
jgi:cytochrome P450